MFYYESMNEQEKLLGKIDDNNREIALALNRLKELYEQDKELHKQLADQVAKSKSNEKPKL